jgi:hypothetical protein
MEGVTPISEIGVKKYHISDLQTLIDINQDITSFIAHISINGPSQFLYSFVTQEDLDNGNINFKVENNLNATVESSESKFQNYYILMKTQGPPFDVNVKIDIQKKDEVTQLKSLHSKPKENIKSAKNINYRTVPVITADNTPVYIAIVLIIVLALVYVARKRG